MFLLALVHVASKPGQRLGGDPRERAGGARGGREHHAVQDVGLRARVVHDGRRRLPARGAGRAADRAARFPTQDSLTLLATALIGGIFSLWGAVVAGVFYSARAVHPPGRSWGSTRTSCFIIFGVGLLQVLLTAPGGIVQQLPKDLANLGRLIARPFRKAARRIGGRSS